MKRSRYPSGLLLWPWLLLLLSSGACDSSRAAEGHLTIAAAASTRFAIEALCHDFEQRSNIRITIITGSSGKLTAQIREGAPYDLFISADEQYPISLRGQNRTVGPPEAFANGSLVLWSVSLDTTVALSDLRNDTVLRHLAIANPATAPYGRAAMEVLQKAAPEAATTNKLVYGESIAQVNQFISSGAAEAGFTALSVVLAPGMKQLGWFTRVNDSLHAPIVHAAVVIQTGNKEREATARSFLRYLHSEESGKILRRFGYTLPG